MEDAIKMEKIIREMAGQVAATEAKRLDAIIMGVGVDIPTDASTNAPEGGAGYSPSIMGYQVIRSKHVPDDAIYTIEKVPSLKFTSEITAEYDRKYDMPIIKSVMRIESLPLFYGDYVSLVDRLEIKLFTWPRYVAICILMFSLIVIMLLVAR